jgi:hypothetical protein
MVSANSTTVPTTKSRGDCTNTAGESASGLNDSGPVRCWLTSTPSRLAETLAIRRP